jgi:hypothetical protein
VSVSLPTYKAGASCVRVSQPLPACAERNRSSHAETAEDVSRLLCGTLQLQRSHFGGNLIILGWNTRDLRRIWWASIIAPESSAAPSRDRGGLPSQTVCECAARQQSASPRYARELLQQNQDVPILTAFLRSWSPGSVQPRLRLRRISLELRGEERNVTNRDP